MSWLSEADSLAWEGLGIAAVMDLEGDNGAGAGYNARIGILRASSGSTNIIPRPFVSAWNGAGVDPTFGAGINLVGAITVAVPNGVYNTFVMATGGPVVFAPFNLGIAVWTDAQVGAGGRLRMSRCFNQAYGAIANPVKPGDALYGSMCDARIESSANGNIPPGTAAGAGSGFAAVPGGYASYKFRSRKLYDPLAAGTNPTRGVATWSPSTGALNRFTDTAAMMDVPAAVTNVDQDSCIFQTITGSPLTALVRGHIQVNADL